MNRLKKEMISRGIVYHCDGGYEEERELICVQGKHIITLWGCNVLPLELHIFDSNLHLVAKQDLFPDTMFFSEGRTWNSQVFTKEDWI